MNQRHAPIGSPVLARALLARLDLAFAGQPRTVADGERTVVTFPAWNEEVGDLAIEVFGEELVVSLGRFTHLHFDEPDAADGNAARAERLADRVVAFVRDVFADRVEFYGNARGGACRPRGGPRRGLLSRWWLGSRTYVWSGPLPDPEVAS
jgi:hypothetical protein